jgi:hypothetical protein
MGWWSGGVMKMKAYRNKNRGYQQLRVWQDAIDFSVLGESVSGLVAYNEAGKISDSDFSILDTLAFRLENGLLKLVESPERKEADADWNDHLILEEAGVACGGTSSADAPSSTPSLQHSTPPIRDHGTHQN